jgi:putative tributyrin esterase
VGAATLRIVEIPELEISDPRFEIDGIRALTVASDALGGRGDISLHVPDDVGPGVPLVLLLHGAYSSHWAWFGKGGAHRTARRLVAAGRTRPMVLACPSDGLWRASSGYLDHSGGGFETWIVRDVVASVRGRLGLDPEASPLFIAGLSMGGYGALRLGAKHAGLFAGVSAHSSVTRAEDAAAFLEEAADPAVLPREELDVLAWMERRRAGLPPIRFDCGTGDNLLAANRWLHGALDAAGIEHTYAEFEGGHTWAYWAAHLEDSLLFFESVLRGGRPARS